MRITLGIVVFLFIISTLFIAVIRETQREITSLQNSSTEIRKVNPENKTLYNEHDTERKVGIKKANLSLLTKDDQYGEMLYNKHDKVTYNGKWIRHLKLSPLQNRAGFLTSTDNSTTTDVSLTVMDIAEKSFKKVYKGGCTTSGWKWFSNNEVLVSYNCGTECKVLYIINVNSGEKHTLQYGVGHQWSPDKTMVLAYHYTAGPGITIGDKFGKVLFELIRRHPFEYNKLVDMTEARWTPDSAKIALIIKKENQEILELIVFDVKQNFKQIFQKDLRGERNDVDFFWQEKGKKLVYYDLNKKQEINFQ